MLQLSIFRLLLRMVRSNGQCMTPVVAASRNSHKVACDYTLLNYICSTIRKVCMQADCNPLRRVHQKFYKFDQSCIVSTV